MTILTRSKDDEGGEKSTLRRDKKVSREADLNHRPKDDYEHAHVHFLVLPAADENRLYKIILLHKKKLFMKCGCTPDVNMYIYNRGRSTCQEAVNVDS
jgi:hypothetical protein